MLKWNRSLSLGITAFLVLFLASTLSFMVSPAKADVPTVTSVAYEVRTPPSELEELPPEGFLIISIQHTAVPPNDYIDKIEIDRDGTVYELGTPGIDMQPTGTFVIQVYLGINADIEEQDPNVKVRAHSFADGWGAWSESVVVPEFSGVFFVFALVVCAGTVMLMKRMRRDASTAP